MDPMPSPSDHSYCSEVFDHLQMASVQLQKASILSDDCFKTYRRAKLLVPRPAETVPPLDGLPFPHGLSADWIALHQELLTIEDSMPVRHREKRRSLDQQKVKEAPQAATAVVQAPVSSSSPSVGSSRETSDSSSSGRSIELRQPRLSRPPRFLPQLRLDRAGRGAWLGGDATAGETYAR